MNALPPFFERKSLFFQILFLLFFVVAGSVIFSLVGVALSSLIWSLPYDALTACEQVHYLRFNQFVSMLGVWLCPALLFSYGHHRNLWQYNGAALWPSTVLLGWTCLLAVVMLPVVSFMGYLNQMILLPDFLSGVEEWMKAKETQAEDLLKLLTEDTGLLNLCLNVFVMGVMPAVCEEFFFQGTLQPMLSRSMKNTHAAIWLTAFVFSAIHLQFYGFIPRFLLGAYLGYLFAWSGSLWLPIVAHLLHNLFSLLVQNLATRNGVDTSNFDFLDEYFGAALIVTGLLSVVISYGIYRLWKNRDPRREFFT